MATLTKTRTITSAPNLFLVVSLFTIAYLGDLILTAVASTTAPGFYETNPFFGAHVNRNAWLVPVAAKAFGTLLVWVCAFYFRSDQKYARLYAWLIGGFAVLYVLVDFYSLVLLTGGAST